MKLVCGLQGINAWGICSLECQTSWHISLRWHEVFLVPTIFQVESFQWEWVCMWIAIIEVNCVRAGAMLQVLLCTCHMCCLAASLTWRCQPHLAGCFSADFPSDGLGPLAYARPAKQLYLQRSKLKKDYLKRHVGIDAAADENCICWHNMIAGYAAESDERRPCCVHVHELRPSGRREISVKDHGVKCQGQDKQSVALLLCDPGRPL